MRHRKVENITLEAALSYRFPMPVKETFFCKEGFEYPVCPRCKTTLEREYQSFCDRCGQALDWKKY